MTNNNGDPVRRGYLGAAAAVFATGTIGGALIRSGTVADGLLTNWYGHVAVVLAVVTVAVTGLYLLNCAYDR